jgi:hypothetical protein
VYNPRGGSPPICPSDPKDVFQWFNYSESHVQPSLPVLHANFWVPTSAALGMNPQGWTSPALDQGDSPWQTNTSLTQPFDLLA